MPQTVEEDNYARADVPFDLQTAMTKQGHQSNTDVNTLMLFEGYTSEAAVDEHRNSAHFQNLVVGNIIPNLQNREVILASQLNFD